MEEKNNISEIVLTSQDGEILASSREIAKHFNKQHAEVLYAIEGRTAWDESKGKNVVKHNGLLMVGDDQLLKMFIKSEYVDSRGRNHYEYLMNRDGFALLVMGFSGKEALEWKLKYIEAFNKMEEKLKESNILSEEEKFKLMLFSKNPSEVAWASNRLVELATVPLLETIDEQKNTIEQKQEVINGFTDDIDIYTKKDIINRICKRSCGNYANRYKELYRSFKEIYHIDLVARCEGYNLKQVKKKDKLSVVQYADNFAYIDSLYTCCAKLYETEVNQILEELNKVIC